MRKCPVCEKVNDGYICTECGFDGSQNYEAFPTFGMVKGLSISARKQERSVWQPCAYCGGKRFYLDRETKSLRCAKCNKPQQGAKKDTPMPQKSAKASAPQSAPHGKRLQKCTVCGTENDSLLCSRCGYDGSLDCLKYPTLCSTLPANYLSVIRKSIPNTQPLSKPLPLPAVPGGLPIAAGDHHVAAVNGRQRLYTWPEA